MDIIKDEDINVGRIEDDIKRLNEIIKKCDVCNFLICDQRKINWKEVQSIKTVLSNLEALSNMQMAADKDLKKAKQINEEHKKINGELRKKVKELEADLYSVNSIIDELIEVNKELEAKLEFKKWGDLDDLRFEEYMNEFIPKQKIKDKIEELKELVEDFEKTDNIGRFKRTKSIDYYKLEALEELLQEENK